MLVSRMKDSRGINFIYFNEDDAVDYLTNVNSILELQRTERII